MRITAASDKWLLKTSHTEELLDVVEVVEYDDAEDDEDDEDDEDVGGGGGGRDVCAISGYYLLPSH